MDGNGGLHTGALRSTLEFHIAMIDVDQLWVHFCTYTNWMDRGINDLFRRAGHSVGALLGQGWGVPVVHCHLDYRNPCKLDDHVQMITSIKEVGHTSFQVQYDFLRLDGGGALTHLVHAETTHVCLDTSTQLPRAVPEWLNALVVSQG